MEENSDCKGSSICCSSKVYKFVEEKKKFTAIVSSNHKGWRKWTFKENIKDFYAILPPLDTFLTLDKPDALKHIWNCFECGDITIGRVNSIFAKGLNLNLLSFDAGKSRELDKYKIEAWCPVKEIPKETNHEDVLLRFNVNDILRCVIINVNIEKPELVVSLRISRIHSDHDDLKLGKVDVESLPLSYQRQLAMQNSYEDILCKSVGFVNTNSIGYLMSRLHIPPQNMSLTKALVGKRYAQEDFAESLRKRQSRKVADASVKKGIKKFKSENYIEALQDFNYALDMDTENVDALVARGALYANRGTMSRAIHDFEGALKIEPHHKNAKIYLVTVLLDRAKQISSQINDINQVKEVEKCYSKALNLDPRCGEAKIALTKLAEEQKEKGRKKSTPEPDSSPETKKYTEAAQKLRNILKSDSGIAKKRRLSETSNSRSEKKKSSDGSDSSTSSSSSSSDSSSSSSSDSSSSTSSDDDSTENIKKRKTRKKDIDGIAKYARGRDNQLESKKSSSRYSSKELCNSQSSELKNCKRRHSDIPRAIIQSNIRNDHRKSDGNRRSFDSDKRYREKGNMPDISSSQTNLTNITKENFNNILNEISKFEVIHK